MTDYPGDDANGGNRCVSCNLDVTGKGRLEGRVGQQFYWDTGSNNQTGMQGTIRWVGDGLLFRFCYRKM